MGCSLTHDMNLWFSEGVKAVVKGEGRYGSYVACTLYKNYSIMVLLIEINKDP